MEQFFNEQWIIVSVVVVLLLFYMLYVRLITLRNKVHESASGIDVQLKKRYDLIPNMLQMAAKFMEHEKSLMTEVAELRTRAMASTFVGSPQEKMELESLLNQKLNEFKVSLENYPDLKSNETMIIAMQSMNEIEEHISAARRFYNSNVNSLKNAVDIFPSSVVASLVGVSYEKTPFFEIPEVERNAINSKDYFK